MFGVLLVDLIDCEFYSCVFVFDFFGCYWGVRLLGLYVDVCVVVNVIVEVMVNVYVDYDNLCI